MAQDFSFGWDIESTTTVVLLRLGLVHQKTTFQQAKSRHLLERFHYIIEQVLDEYCPQSIVTLSHHGFIILPHLTGSMTEMQDQLRS